MPASTLATRLPAVTIKTSLVRLYEGCAYSCRHELTAFAIAIARHPPIMYMNIVHISLNTDSRLFQQDSL